MKKSSVKLSELFEVIHALLMHRVEVPTKSDLHAIAIEAYDRTLY